MNNYFKNLSRVAKRSLATVSAQPLAKQLCQNDQLAASVIITTRNKSTYLELTLASLERQIFPQDSWEVIVIDDASHDDTPDIIEKYQKRVQINLKSQRSIKCRGRAGARNDAIKLAWGKILVLLDDDRIAAPDFLIRHLAHHTDKPFIVHGNIQSRIHTHVSAQIDTFLWQLTHLLRRDTVAPKSDNLLKVIMEATDLDNAEYLETLTDVGHPNYFSVVQAFDSEGFAWLNFTAGNASIPREQVLAIGGFDEGFHGWGLEDNDLALCLQEAGIPFRFEPRAVNLHQIHVDEPTKVADHRRNMSYFFDKHPNIDRADMEPLLKMEIADVEWIKRRQERKGGLSSKSSSPRQGHPNERLLSDSGIYREKCLATSPDILIDCLQRVEVTLPDSPLVAGRCIATVVTTGFATWLDDLLSSLTANGLCKDALIVVFAVDADEACMDVIDKHQAIGISCHALVPTTTSVKSVLYSVAHVVEAQQYLCLDADMLVMGDLNPLFTTIESCHEQSILVCSDSIDKNKLGLEHYLFHLYAGNAKDLKLLLGDVRTEGDYPLVVNDGLFAGRRTAFLNLDDTIRAMPQAVTWCNENALRNQFVFNLALAQLSCGVELDGCYNVQLLWEDIRLHEQDKRTQATWQDRPARVLHFNGFDGRQKHTFLRPSIKW